MNLRKPESGELFHLEVSSIQDNQQPFASTNEKVGFLSLMRYATKYDVLLMVVGFITTLLNGIAVPMLGLLTGSAADALGKTDPLQAILPTIKLYIIIGFVTLVLSSIQIACWQMTSQRQALQIRKRYVRSLMKQQLSWYELQNSAQFSNKLSTQVNCIQKALADGVLGIFMPLSTITAALVISFIKGWKLTLVSMIMMPIVAIAGYLFGNLIKTQSQITKEVYSRAGGKAEEVITSIPTVKALCGQQYEEEKYTKIALEALFNSISTGWKAAFAIGFFISTIPLTSALTFYVGSVFVTNGDFNQSTGSTYAAGDILSIFFSILIGGINLGQSIPTLRMIGEGVNAGAKIFEIIQRQPKIGNGPRESQPPVNCNIFFNKVQFKYATRNQYVLRELNLEILAGCKNAIVGDSGSGKSTIAQLLLRFYDPTNGSISFESEYIMYFKLKYLTDCIGYVGQQPTLFATTIRQNILFGKPTATQEQIVRSLKLAQAWEFIQKLPFKLQTFVGAGGSQLSGGQKQRLAIARALIKNPKILILDEATSALDRRNQALIQSTLDIVSKGLTTIVIAHKLKTITDSHRINVISNGKLEVKGTHSQLLKSCSWYRQASEKQMVNESKESIVSQNKFDDFQDTTMVPYNQQGQIQGESKGQLCEFMTRLASYSKQNYNLFVVAYIVALANGTLLPIYSIFLARTISLILVGISREDGLKMGLVFLGLGILIFLFAFIQYGLFNFLSQRLGFNIRKDIFSKLLQMPLSFFQTQENTPGKLSAYLFDDINNVNRLTSNFIGLNLQNVSSLVSGIIIAFVHSWKLTLVSLGVMPLMILAALVQLACMSQLNQLVQSHYRQSSGLLSQMILAIKTIKGLGRQKWACKLYQSKIQFPADSSNKRSTLSGIFFGISQLIFFIVFAIIFAVGAVFLRDDLAAGINQSQGISNIFVTVLAILFSSTPIGYYSHYIPDIAAGKNSCKRIFELLDRTDIENRQGTSRFPQNLKKIRIKDVDFTFPSRKQPAVRGLSVELFEKHKLGLAGQSGSGKSTILQLLLKFFKADRGEISFDGVDIEKIDSKSLRQNVAIVSQEPVLFNSTLRQNICYNKSVDEDFYRRVKKLANIDFIQDQDFVGIKGGLLSGGQKQRIAVARAIVRRPQLLLLDEATSALDSQNEKIVQQAIEELSKGITSITVAHRLNTIEQSDKILLMKEGRVVQEGDFKELMSLKGLFYKLQKGIQF